MKWLIVVMALFLVGCADAPAPAPTPEVDTPKFQKGEATGLAQAWLSICSEDGRGGLYLRNGEFTESYVGNGKWKVSMNWRAAGKTAEWEVFEDSLSVHLLHIDLC